MMMALTNQMICMKTNYDNDLPLIEGNGQSTESNREQERDCSVDSAGYQEVLRDHTN